MKGFTAKGLYPNRWVSIVIRAKNPNYSFRNILGDAVKHFVNTHKTTLLLKLSDELKRDKVNPIPRLL